MNLWIFYSLVSLLLSLFLASLSRRFYFPVFILSFVCLITPAQIEAGSSTLSPSLFTFIYDLVFQQEISVRVLRPLIITMPASVCALLALNFLRRRFF